jgi:hypothetical protein
MTDDLRKSVDKFLYAFEKVFDEDWSYTKEQLGMYSSNSELKDDPATIHLIAPNGTFLDPKIDDEKEDWGYRGMLLEEYRNLKLLLLKNR